MALLDQIIDGATDDAVSTANLLRKASIVAHRIAAADLGTWVDHELGGYSDLSDSTSLPTYRGPFITPVLGTYLGYFGRQINNARLDPTGAPDYFVEAYFHALAPQSLADLEEMARTKGDVSVIWSERTVAVWNELEDERKVTGFEDMNLFGARQVITRSRLVGIVDSIRNQVLRLALDLRAAGADVGEANGPTVNEPQVGESVTQFITHIYGNPASIAVGAQVTQTVNVGDLGGLLNAAQAVGLTDPAALAELTVAATSDDKPSKLKEFLGKIGGGAFKLAGDVTTKVAMAELTPMIEQFLGHH